MMVGRSCSLGGTPDCQEPLPGPPHFLSAMSTVCRMLFEGPWFRLSLSPQSDSLTGPRGIACYFDSLMKLDMRKGDGI